MRTAVLTLFAILVAHTLIETARDALFLSGLPASRLPWVYVLIAVVTLSARRAARRALARVHGTRLLAALLLLSAVITTAFWLLTAWPSPWLLVALYVWPAMFAAIVIVEFWRLLADSVTTTEAKAVFSRVAAGAAAGGLAGGLLALILAMVFDARHLLLVGALLLASTGAALGRDGRAVEADDHGDERQTTLLESVQLIGSHRYPRRVFALLLLAATTVTLVDFVFKSGAAARVPPTQLAAFFAASYFALNALGLVVQRALAERLIGRLGIVNASAVLPASLAVCAVAVATTGGALAVVLLKCADGALRNSLHRTAAELLYVPMRLQVRNRVKGVIDILTQRGGQLAGSVTILVVLAAGGGNRMLAGLIIGCGLAAVLIVTRLKQPYLDLFRETLGAEAVDTRLAYPAMNVGSVSTLMAALGSADAHEAVAALELLAEQQRPELIPTLVLFHPAPEVAVRGLDLLTAARRRDATWAARRLLHDQSNPSVRAAALRLLMVADPGADPAQALHDPSPAVRATAAVYLSADDGPERAQADAVVAALASEPDTDGQVALATAIGQQSAGHLHAGFEDVLITLAAGDDAAVRLAAVTAMSERPSTSYLPTLQSMLNDRALRPVARTGFLAIGAPALEFLARGLPDLSLPADIRLHIPRSMSRFAASEAIPILLRALATESDGAVRFKVLRGLGRLRGDAPEVAVDIAAVDEAIARFTSEALRLGHWAAVIDADAAPSSPDAVRARTLLTALMRDLDERAVETVFRLLAIRHPEERFDHVFRGLRGGRTARASSVELIEHLVPPRLKRAILALVSDLSLADRIEAGRGVYEAQTVVPEEAISRLVADATGPLRAVAALYAGNLGLTALHDVMQHAREQEPSELRSLIDQGLRMLAVDGHVR